MVKPLLHRRTVLKTIGTGIAGGTAIAGSATAAPGRARGRRNELEVVGTHDHDSGDHLFDLGRREVASGWTTEVFHNQTEHTHFTSLLKVPQQAIDDAENRFEMSLLELYIETVTQPFQFFMDSLLGGGDPADLQTLYESDELFFGLFAPWFPAVETYGGAGLTAGHHSSKTTVDLDPGEYIVECYVKDASNEFHSYLGMIEHLSVTGAESGADEPDQTLDVHLDTAEGLNGTIDIDGKLRPGRHTVAVHFDGQQTYEHLVGHDVHLIRFDDDTDAAAVNDWMDWANGRLTAGTTTDDFDQLVSDGAEPGTFVGGVQDMKAGDTGYFHVDLRPGDYAWVAEVPQPDQKGLLQEFSVP